jgi:hypothetical protein
MAYPGYPLRMPRQLPNVNIGEAGAANEHGSTVKLYRQIRLHERPVPPT